MPAKSVLFRYAAIVLVGNDKETIMAIKDMLAEEKWPPVVTLENGKKLLPYLQRFGAMIVFLDANGRHSSGMDLLAGVVHGFPNIPVVMMTSVVDLDVVVAGMKGGANDFIAKPIPKDRLLALVKSAMAMPQKTVLPLQPSSPRRGLGKDSPFAAIKTRNGRMLEIFRYLETVSGSQQPVLIQGETGVGKELMVEALHKASSATGSLIAVNVAGLDGTMFSDTLFGHVRGAYSGADSTRQGLVAAAQGGTLFLDEIGDLDQESQIKLLRLLQEKLYYPLGADSFRSTDARVVCATHVALKDKMLEGSFRADLYYRLAAHQVSIPPLRERIDDIPLLTEHFIAESAQALNKPTPRVRPDFFQRLTAYPFPGNVRELQALIHDAVARHADGELSWENLAMRLENAGHPSPRFVSGRWDEKNNIFRSIDDPLPSFKEVERQLMEEALRRSKGYQGTAAAMLGISRSALNRRIHIERQRKNKTLQG
ncbi:MAG TPA: sigma-54-dependent Fis family transcriptional regulator [Magnetococcales bacterium]|nr:sigma-54-dependent Fis family transcriptional regulator [Magnetococcales bacterium]